MAKIEDAIVDGVVNDLDAGEAPAASKGATGVHAGPGTSSMNYGPGTSTTGGGVVGINESAGTRPLAGVFVDPSGGGDVSQDGGETPGEDAADLTKVIAQLKIDRAEAAESYRRFCSGPRPESGYVAGLEHLQALHERNKS